MTVARTTPEQQRNNGILAGSVALMVALVGDERVTPFHMLLAFTGGYIIGSRPVILTVEEPA